MRPFRNFAEKLTEEKLDAPARAAATSLVIKYDTDQELPFTESVELPRFRKPSTDFMDTVAERALKKLYILREDRDRALIAKELPVYNREASLKATFEAERDRKSGKLHYEPRDKHNMTLVFESGNPDA